MPYVTGGGGAAFNGGTITQPLTVLETDGTSKGVVINTQGAGGVNALEIDAPNTTVTIDGDGTFLYSSGDTAGFEVQGTGGTNASVVIDGNNASLSVGGVATSTVTMSAAASQLNLSGTGESYVLDTAGSAGLTIKKPANTVVAQLAPGIFRTNPPTPATATLSTGTGAQLSTTTDVHSYTPVTFNPTAGAAATCAVAISKDGTNYTALWTETEPAGVTFDGTIHGINVYVPAGWKLKLTVTNATIGTTTYY